MWPRDHSSIRLAGPYHPSSLLLVQWRKEVYSYSECVTSLLRKWDYGWMSEATQVFRVEVFWALILPIISDRFARTSAAPEYARIGKYRPPLPVPFPFPSLYCVLRPTPSNPSHNHTIDFHHIISLGTASRIVLSRSQPTRCSLCSVC